AVDRLGNLEGRMLPADRLAGGRDLLVAERRAVDRVGPRLVGRALADHRLAADERWFARIGARLLDRRPHGARVMAVDVGDDVPAIGGEAHRRVVAKPALDPAVDGMSL